MSATPSISHLSFNDGLQLLHFLLDLFKLLESLLLLLGLLLDISVELCLTSVNLGFEFIDNFCELLEMLILLLDRVL